jgi:hypothetical protein
VFFRWRAAYSRYSPAALFRARSVLLAFREAAFLRASLMPLMRLMPLMALMRPQPWS